MDEYVASATAGELGGSEVDLAVSVRAPLLLDVPEVQHAVAVAMLEGLVMDEAGARQVRADVLAQRQEACAPAMEGLRRAAGALGAAIVEEEPVACVATLRLGADRVQALLDLVAPIAATQHTEDQDEAGYAWSVDGPLITGYELEDLIQSEQYYDRTYWAAGQVAGLKEGGADNLYLDHPGFDDVFGAGRLQNCAWDGTACTWPVPSAGGEHSTAVASVLLGDITAAQDYVVTPLSGNNWRERSGVARMAEGIGDDGSAYFLSSSFAGKVLNQSAAAAGNDCTGVDSASTTANAYFETGIAFFKSAGNEGNSANTWDCRTTPPGSAIGTFPVAAYYVDEATGEEEIYSDDAQNGSSRGGTWLQGRGRTITALATPGRIQYPYPWNALLESAVRYGTDWLETNEPPPEDVCCTSSSTPVASGAALLFRDWYLDVVDSSIDDPGFLYANLLLMGDRTGEGGSLSTGFDGLWGAGKLRLRMWDNEGLDGPWGWGDGSLCIDAGTSTWVPIATSARLDDEVDVIRAVAWWYDRRHGQSATFTIDQIGLEIRQFDQLLPPTAGTLVGDDAGGTDNKLRVQVDDPVADKFYRMKLSAESVTADDEGCGENAMRVYYAWFYEDSDRQAEEALSNVRPE